MFVSFVFPQDLGMMIPNIWDDTKCESHFLGFFPKQVSFAARNYEQAVWNMLNRGMWSVEVFTVLDSISVMVLDFYGLEFGTTIVFWVR